MTFLSAQDGESSYRQVQLKHFSIWAYLDVFFLMILFLAVRLLDSGLENIWKYLHFKIVFQKVL